MLLGWILWIFPDPCASRGKREDHFYLPLYSTFSYHKMPFGLCNAPATFQRCMMSIFSEFIEQCMKVFMDDFSVYGNSF